MMLRMPTHPINAVFIHMVLLAKTCFPSYSSIYYIFLNIQYKAMSGILNLCAMSPKANILNCTLVYANAPIHKYTLARKHSRNADASLNQHRRLPHFTSHSLNQLFAIRSPLLAARFHAALYIQHLCVVHSLLLYMVASLHLWQSKNVYGYVYCSAFTGLLSAQA